MSFLFFKDGSLQVVFTNQLSTPTLRVWSCSRLPATVNSLTTYIACTALMLWLMKTWLNSTQGPLYFLFFGWMEMVLFFQFYKVQVSLTSVFWKALISDLCILWRRGGMEKEKNGWRKRWGSDPNHNAFFIFLHEICRLLLTTVDLVHTYASVNTHVHTHVYTFTHTLLPPSTFLAITGPQVFDLCASFKNNMIARCSDARL